MAESAEVPEEVVVRLRSVCLGLPDAYEEPAWVRDVAGMVLDDRVDWEEVAELLTESYCVLAPKKLVALVDRPSG